MQNFILSLEGAFPSIYTQSKLLNSTTSPLSLPLSSVPLTNSNGSVTFNNSSSSNASSLSHSSSASSLTHSNPSTATSTDEILPNKLPLKRRLVEFRFGRDGGNLVLGKKSSKATATTFTTNPFAFDKFKDISPALTVHLHEDGVILEPGGVGVLSYSHPTIQSLLNSINNCTLPPELFVTLFELTHSHSSTGGQSIFYDSCVVVGIVDWRGDMTLTIGHGHGNGNLGSVRPVGGNFSMTANNSQWARRLPPFNNPSGNHPFTPEMHKVLLKPSPDCWQFALAFLASLPEGEKFARILEDEESLLEFERQLILINEPVVCLDPSPTVMLAMNALHFDRLKHRLYQPISVNSTPPDGSVFEALENTLMNLAALKPQNSQSLVNKPATTTTASTPSLTAITTTTTTPTTSLTSPTTTTSTATTTTNIINQRYRRISVIESWQEREKRRTTEPIYGIDHRRQFVKNRQPLPPSSFVPPNWRPFKTIRYEREIIVQSPVASVNVNMNVNVNVNVNVSSTEPLGSSSDTSNSTSLNNNNTNNTNSSNSTTSTNTTNTTNTSTSLAKLYYCVNVFYAPPPTYPPIQLFLQVGTTPDTSISGFLHRLNFTNLVETENYLQNLRNLLLIENGNCNLKVITDISTTGTTTSSTSSVVLPVNNPSVNPVVNVNSGQGQGMIRKQTQTQSTQSQTQPHTHTHTQTQTQTQSQSQTQTQTQIKVPLQARQTQGPPTTTVSNPSQTQTHTQTQFSVSSPPQFQLTPHQILQLNQQRTSKDSLLTVESVNGGVINNNNNNNNNNTLTNNNNNSNQGINQTYQFFFSAKSPPTQ